MSNNKTNILSRIRAFEKDMEDVEIIKATEAYGYHYAELKDIIKAITPLLHKHKIWYHQYTGYELTALRNTVVTSIYCIDDEEDCVVSRTLVDPEATIGGMTRFMVEGSAITYFKRYHLIAMLNLIADEDHDAGGKRTKKSPQSSNIKGRGVEKASENTPDKPNFVDIFTKMTENKTKAQVNKTFGLYKSQMDNEEINKIQKIIDDKYGN